MNSNLKIRKALPKDSEFLFNLRNEESVRAVSLNSAPISLDTHQQWFGKKLASKNSVIFIGEIDNRPISQTRYDANGEEAEVGIAVAKEFRGRGLGSEILQKTAQQFFKDFPEVKAIKAFINLGNDASLRSFAKAGYEPAGKSDEGGLARNLMVLAKK